MKNVVHILSDDKIILEVRQNLSPQKAQQMATYANAIWKDGGVVALQASNFEISDDRPETSLAERVSNLEAWVSNHTRAHGI